MDLGEMRRKLHNGKYRSRSDFFADIALIISNCRTYNEDVRTYHARCLLRIQGTIYVEHANELEKEAWQLMQELNSEAEHRYYREMLGELSSSAVFAVRKPLVADSLQSFVTPAMTPVPLGALANSGAAGAVIAEPPLTVPTSTEAVDSDSGDNERITNEEEEFRRQTRALRLVKLVCV